MNKSTEINTYLSQSFHIYLYILSFGAFFIMLKSTSEQVDSVNILRYILY